MSERGAYRATQDAHGHSAPRPTAIPSAAVEAAAEAMEDAALSLIGSDLGTVYRNDIARAALEAAASYMLADAWEAGAVHTLTDTSRHFGSNPYRPNP